ncbi:MAG TPA: guanylate kinase [Bacteroidales bacterium]|nr:guanylate kinase [Bacteroidales bacterium]
MGSGRLVIVSAPSGAGKSTMVRALLNAGLGLNFSVSACNRPPRGREVHGREYFFFSTEEFLRMIGEGAFLEWEEVYPGRYYGTLRSEVERLLASGKHVIFDVDVMGGLNIKRQYGARALALFIMPPSPEVLEQRLRKRSTESEQELSVRLGKASEEMARADEFDAMIVNEDLEVAIAEAIHRVSAFLHPIP